MTPTQFKPVQRNINTESTITSSQLHPSITAECTACMNAALASGNNTLQAARACSRLC